MGNNKLRPFPVKCAIIFLSNIDFSKPQLFPGKLYETHVKPVLSRGVLISLSFNDRDIYEYTGYVATERHMLRDLSRDQQKLGQAKTRRNLTLEQSNDVLKLFHDEAEFWRDGLTPRQLQQIAEARIGVDHDVWLADCHQLFLSTQRLRTLRDLPLFQVKHPREPADAEPAIVASPQDGEPDRGPEPTIIASPPATPNPGDVWVSGAGNGIGFNLSPEIRDGEKRKKRELVRVDSLEPLGYMTAGRNNATHWRRWTEYRDINGDWRTVPGSASIDPIVSETKVLVIEGGDPQ